MSKKYLLYIKNFLNIKFTNPKIQTIITKRQPKKGKKNVYTSFKF